MLRGLLLLNDHTIFAADSTTGCKYAIIEAVYDRPSRKRPE